MAINEEAKKLIDDAKELLSKWKRTNTGHSHQDAIDFSEIQDKLKELNISIDIEIDPNTNECYIEYSED